MARTNGAPNDVDLAIRVEGGFFRGRLLYGSLSTSIARSTSLILSAVKFDVEFGNTIRGSYT